MVIELIFKTRIAQPQEDKLIQRGSGLNVKPFFQIAPKEECEEGLTKLFGCSACQGIPSIKPCSNFCLNVMRGCLAYHSELGESWDKFVGKLLHDPLKFRNLGSGTGNLIIAQRLTTRLVIKRSWV